MVYTTARCGRICGFVVFFRRVNKCDLRTAAERFNFSGHRLMTDFPHRRAARVNNPSVPCGDRITH